jgi:hypothetical protein
MLSFTLRALTVAALFAVTTVMRGRRPWSSLH